MAYEGEQTGCYSGGRITEFITVLMTLPLKFIVHVLRHLQEGILNSDKATLVECVTEMVNSHAALAGLSPRHPTYNNNDTGGDDNDEDIGIIPFAIMITLDMAMVTMTTRTATITMTTTMMLLLLMHPCDFDPV